MTTAVSVSRCGRKKSAQADSCPEGDTRPSFPELVKEWFQGGRIRQPPFDIPGQTEGGRRDAVPKLIRGMSRIYRIYSNKKKDLIDAGLKYLRPYDAIIN